jgi:hypothetical protein
VAAHQDDVRDVVDLVRGHWRVLAVRAAADLGLIDALADGVPDSAALAARVDVPPDQLVRLLRVLEDVGLVEQDAAGGLALTGRGQLLRADDPSGLHSLLAMQTWPPHLLSWGRLPDALRSGAGTFEAANGASLWKLMAGDPDQSRVFNAAMARRGAWQAGALLEAVDLTDVTTVVDVGGGRGAMLTALLTEVDRLHGIVADQPHVVAEAASALAAAGLADRCQVLPADFFAAVPANGDAYVLSNILHDWNDDESVAILRVVRAAMPAHARLWVLERVLDPDPPRDPFEQTELHLLDLHMLVTFGARERSVDEYAALLTAAGFTAPDVRRTSVPFDVLECRPAGS